MNNHNKNLNKNQASNENNLRIRKYKQNWPKVDCWPMDEIVANRDTFFKTFKAKRLILLNSLIYLSEKYKGNIFVLQNNLAKKAGISREWCNKELRVLEEFGLIVSNYRHMQSCQYKLSSWFNNPHVRSALSHTFKALRIGLLACLFPNSAPAEQFKHQFTHIKVRDLSLSKSIYLSDKYYNRNNHSTKRIVQMNAETTNNNPISITIREITCLSLTKWGQIRLSAFPDGAINHAIDAFRFVGKLKDPFAFFVSKCMEYCRNNNLIPDWQFSGQLAVKYKQPHDAPMLLRIKSPDGQKEYKKKEVQKQEAPKPASEWKQESNARFRPMRHSFHEYPGMTQEQRDIQQNYKKFADKQQEDYEARKAIDYSKNFLPGCQIDHEKEFEVFFSDKARENLQKQTLLFGEKTANGFFERMVNNHIECQQKNHNLSLKENLEVTFGAKAIPVNDEPPITDYALYEEDYSDVVLEL